MKGAKAMEQVQTQGGSGHYTASSSARQAWHSALPLPAPAGRHRALRRDHPSPPDEKQDFTGVLWD